MVNKLVLGLIAGLAAIGAAALYFILGAKPKPKPDPCGGVDCGSHGSCNGSGGCTCKDNYSGDKCQTPPVPAPTPDPCGGVTCDSKSHCDNGTCVCNNGWKTENGNCVLPCGSVTSDNIVAADSANVQTKTPSYANDGTTTKISRSDLCAADNQIVSDWITTHGSNPNPNPPAPPAPQPDPKKTPPTGPCDATGTGAPGYDTIALSGPVTGTMTQLSPGLWRGTVKKGDGTTIDCGAVELTKFKKANGIVPIGTGNGDTYLIVLNNYQGYQTDSARLNPSTGCIELPSSMLDDGTYITNCQGWYSKAKSGGVGYGGLITATQYISPTPPTNCTSAICNNGYHCENNKCVKDAPAPGPSPCTKTCDGGMVLNSGNCTCYCPSGTVWDGSKCASNTTDVCKQACAGKTGTDYTNCMTVCKKASSG